MQDESKRAAAAKKRKVALEPHSEVGLRKTLAVVTAAVDLVRAGAVADDILEARHRLDTRRYTALRLILAGRRYPSEIAEAMHLPPSAITRALNALADDRLIVRAIDREDSRRMRLALTPKGEQMFEAATRSLSDWIVPQLHGIGEAEFEGFVRTVAAFKKDPPKKAE